MAQFELDLAFTPEQVVDGLERLFAQRGRSHTRRCTGQSSYELEVRCEHAAAMLRVQPLPAERLTYASFFPRTLLQVHADDTAVLDGLRREIVLAFLRTMG